MTLLRQITITLLLGLGLMMDGHAMAAGAAAQEEGRVSSGGRVVSHTEYEQVRNIVRGTSTLEYKARRIIEILGKNKAMDVSFVEDCCAPLGSNSTHDQIDTLLSLLGCSYTRPMDPPAAAAGPAEEPTGAASYAMRSETDVNPEDRDLILGICALGSGMPGFTFTEEKLNRAVRWIEELRAASRKSADDFQNTWSRINKMQSSNSGSLFPCMFTFESQMVQFQGFSQQSTMVNGVVTATTGSQASASSGTIYYLDIFNYQTQKLFKLPLNKPSH